MSRNLFVEERAGVGRSGELVRAPIFLFQGECAAPDDLSVVSTESGVTAAPIVCQADDIRRGPDGGVARLHLWFEADVSAGKSRAFRLARRTSPAAAPAPTVPIEISDQGIRVSTDAGVYEFTADGGLRTIPGGREGWHFAGGGAFPAVVVSVPATDSAPAMNITLDRTSSGREVSWSTGPLFAKLRVRVQGPDGTRLELDYRVPRHGREVIVTLAWFPGPRGAVAKNRLLDGVLEGGAPALAKVPAGIRYALRSEHAYAVSGLTGKSNVATLLAIPLVFGGSNGQWSVGADGAVALEGQQGLKRGDEGEKDTLAAFWTEVRLVPVATKDPEKLWLAYREHVQPLVAIVEESGANRDALHAALAEIAREMKPIGWRQEAARALVLGERSRMARVLNAVVPAKEGDVASLVQGARNDTAKLTNQGQRKLREDEKGRAYGRLDPYHITYTQSAAAALVAFASAPPTITEVNYAMAKAVRDFGGRVDASGVPYIDCFNRTLNMQLGPVLFGLTAAPKNQDDDLVRFYRDLATAPAVQAVFGRGQRPYTGARAETPEQTDFLYQAICDFWLRTTDLLSGEDLHLHRLAYGRYLDCLDVMADRYHALSAKAKPGEWGDARANFFRGQAHTHRWLGWSCAPFIRLLEEPVGAGTIGLTEAIRYAAAQKGRWKNWPDLTFYELADLLVRNASALSTPPPRLSTPSSVSVVSKAAGAELSWPAVNGAVEYWVYRTESDGGPYIWVNSPHRQPSPAQARSSKYVDPDATPGSRYLVLAVDAVGRPSAWPEMPWNSH